VTKSNEPDTQVTPANDRMRRSKPEYEQERAAMTDRQISGTFAPGRRLGNGAGIGRSWLAGLTLMLAGVVASTAVFGEDTPIDGIAAIVNEGVVLHSDVRAELAFLKAQARTNGQTLPTDDVLETRVLERLIDQEIRRQRAQTLGVVVDATGVNRAVEQVARGNNMDALQFRQTLQQQGYDYDQFRRGIEQELLLQRLVERDVQPGVRVTPREIDDYVAALRDDAAEQTRYRVRHILVSVPASASDEARAEATERARDTVEQLRAGADFASLAAAVSDGARALQGGDLGYRTLKEVPSFLRAALSTLDIGDISEPLSSPDGLHIVRIDERQDGSGSQRSETRARHIFLAGNAAGTAERLADFRERIRNGESFATLAEEFSDDPNSAPEGGELPWFTSGELPPEMERVADTLAAGQMSEPFRTQFGWHLMEILERHTTEVGDEALRQRAANVLSQQRIEQATERWVRRLRDESFVDVRS